MRTHGESTHGQNTPEYRAWSDLWQRCTNPKRRNYARYGGRGMRVCRRWQRYEAFLADMGRRPSVAHSIDRRDNDGNYTPRNCRWATRVEQRRHRVDYLGGRCRNGHTRTRPASRRPGGGCRLCKNAYLVRYRAAQALVRAVLARLTDEPPMLTDADIAREQAIKAGL